MYPLLVNNEPKRARSPEPYLFNISISKRRYLEKEVERNNNCVKGTGLENRHARREYSPFESCPA